jgi:hypothetical protein
MLNTNLPKMLMLGKHNTALGHPVDNLARSKNLCMQFRNRSAAIADCVG